MGIAKRLFDQYSSSQKENKSTSLIDEISTQAAKKNWGRVNFTKCWKGPKKQTQPEPQTHDNEENAISLQA